MLLLTDIASACNDAALASILAIFRRILNLIQIIGPILAIVSMVIHITMLVKDPEDKKRIKKLHNSILALFILFFVPVFVNVTMGLLGDGTTFSSCWNNAIEPSNNNGERYVSPYDDNRKSEVYTNQGDYQK